MLLTSLLTRCQTHPMSVTGLPATSQWRLPVHGAYVYMHYMIQMMGDVVGLCNHAPNSTLLVATTTIRPATPAAASARATDVACRPAAHQHAASLGLYDGLHGVDE